MKKVISLLIVFIFLGFGIDVVKAQNLNILPIDFENADQSNYNPYIGYRGGQIKFNLNFSGGPTDADYQIYVHLINEATGKIDFEKIINPTIPTSKWSSTSQVPVVIDIPSDSKASVWTAYRAVVALKKNDKVLVLNNSSKILKSLPHNESPMGDYYKSINTVYLENGNYIVARILITNSNIYTLPSENPNTVSAGSNLPITLKFEAKNPEWTYDGIICVGNFFSNTHTTSSRLGVKHNPVITLVPAKVKGASFGIKDWIVYNTATSNNISDSDTWRGSISLPVSFNIPKNTKPGKYEIHVIPSVSQPFCAIPSMPGNGTSISMLQSTAQPSNLVGTVNITNGDINTQNTNNVTIYPMMAYLNTRSTPLLDLPYSTKSSIYYPDHTAALQGDNLFFAIDFKGGPIEGDKKLFVYFVDKDNVIKYKTSISPKIPTSNWWSGVNTVSSLIKLPNDLPVGLYSVVSGLYDGYDENNKVTLNSGSGLFSLSDTNSGYYITPKVIANGQQYTVGTVTVISNSNNIYKNRDCNILYNCTTYNEVFSNNTGKYSSPITINKITGPESVPAGSVFGFNLNFVAGKIISVDGREFPIIINIYDENEKIVLRNTIDPLLYPISKWSGQVTIPVSIRIPDSVKPGNYSVRLLTNNQLLVRPFVTGNGVMEYYQGNTPLYEVGKLLVTQKNNTVINEVYSSKLPSTDKLTEPISAINNPVINPNTKVSNPVETNNNASTVSANPTNTNVNSNNQNTNVNVVTNPVVVPENPIPTPKITINQWNINSTHTGTNAQATLSSSLVFSTINFSINFQGGPTVGDKRVFVHFVDSSGNIKFSADLEPSTPSSKWTASSNNWISADVEVPSNIPIGTYNVYAGLYSDSRVELNPGPNVSVDNQKRYKIGTVTISPAPVTVKSSTLVGNVISAVARFFGVSLDK